jgi:hypothetical protein
LSIAIDAAKNIVGANNAFRNTSLPGACLIEDLAADNIASASNIPAVFASGLPRTVGDALRSKSLLFRGLLRCVGLNPRTSQIKTTADECSPHNVFS